MTDSLSDLETADNYISTGSSIKKGNVTRKQQKCQCSIFQTYQVLMYQMISSRAQVLKRKTATTTVIVTAAAAATTTTITT